MGEEATNNIVLSYYDCLLRKADVALLDGPFWLNDALIGFYFEYLDMKFNKDGHKVLSFVGPEVTQLLKMTDPSQYSIFLDPIGISVSKLTFFSLNDCAKRNAVGGSHWSLLLYSQSDKTCYHFDSLRGSNSKVAGEFARNIACYILGKPEILFIEPHSPQQDNGFDCGIYVLCLSDIISENALNSNNIDQCNFNLVKDCARTKRSELLRLISELQKTPNIYK